MRVERDLPSTEAEDLIDLVRDISDGELLPHAAQYEKDETFPREQFRLMGKAGLMGLAYPEELGGGGQPYEVYLQVLEEVAQRWVSVALGMSVHTLTCGPVAGFGTDEQRQMLLPAMLSGELLGGYCLSEAHAGSDPNAMRATAKPVDGGYVANGAKAWVTHGGHADFYTTFLRTCDSTSGGITCFHIGADLDGVNPAPREQKMGMKASHTATINLDDVKVPLDRRIGEQGQGLPIALSALDGGRLGVAAVAVGLAQSALDHALAYAKERKAFGSTIIDFQGVSFMLADMAAAVESARATYLAAARRRDTGKPYARQASIAKLVATDAAMKVTTDAVQVLGGAGYTSDYPVERFMREAKVMQIFEGTNQIQRMVIARHLQKG